MAVVDRRIGLAAQHAASAFASALGAVDDRPQHRQRVGLEHAERTSRIFASSASSRIGLSITSWRTARASRRTCCRPGRRRLERHHERLADRIDRRVRDLREQLVEVRDRCGARSQSTASGVSVPIEPIGSLPVRAIGARITLHVLVGVAERALALARAAPTARRAARLGQRRRAVTNTFLSSHLRYGNRLDDLALELVVVDDPALARVDDEHHARLEPALAAHVLGRHVDHAGLRREDHAIVGRIVQRAGRRPLRSSVAPTRGRR